MIKFNNYPPTQASDIELLPEAKEELDRLNSKVFVGQSDAFQAYGSAVGYTVAASMPEDASFGEIMDIASGVCKSIDPDIAFSSARSDFAKGLSRAAGRVVVAHRKAEAV